MHPDSGIPVFAERGREGSWMLTEGYRTSLTGMKPKKLFLCFYL